MISEWNADDKRRRASFTLPLLEEGLATGGRHQSM